MSNNRETDNLGLGIPSFGFVEKLESYIALLDEAQSTKKLEEFGFSEEAESFRQGDIKELEVRSLLFICYDYMRSENHWVARHDRKVAKKKKGNVK